MRLQYYLFAALLSLSACAEIDLDDVVSVGEGCVKQVATSPAAHGIAKADQATALRLFQQNNISVSNLRFTRFSEKNLTLDGRTSRYAHVFATPFVNGLPVLNGEVGYHFKDGKYYFFLGEQVSIAPDPRPALSLAQVRSAFFKEFVAYSKQSSSYKAQDYVSQCVEAKLGYYTYRGSEAATRTVLAWHVKPEGEDYPEAYISDSESTTIYFFDGVWSSMPR